jgi:hypothetical protein
MKHFFVVQKASITFYDICEATLTTGITFKWLHFESGVVFSI